MGFLEEFVRIVRKPRPINRPRTLIKSGVSDAGVRFGKASDLTYSRKPFTRLEQLYYSDGLIFNGINTWVELICSPGFNIESTDNKANSSIQKWLFDIEFEDEILPKIVQHMGVYGNAYCEIVFNKSGTDIVDLSDPLDPKTISFMTDPRTNTPILDAFGKPVGYIQRVGSGKATEIPAENMAHFKLYTVGSSLLGIGFIEPVFWTALGKRNLDEKIAQQEFRRANPFAYIKVGDKDHPPSAEEIDAVHNAFKDISYKTDFTGPYWYDVQFIQTDPGKSSLEAVRYFQDAMITGIGLPKSLVTGIGEDENRAVLDSLIAVTQRKVSRQQRSISNVMENKIFKKKRELKQYRDTPRMVWNEFSPESLSGKIDRMVKEVQVGLLKPSPELRKLVRQWEKLPVAMREEQELSKNATTKRPEKG